MVYYSPYPALSSRDTFRRYRGLATASRRHQPGATWQNTCDGRGDHSASCRSCSAAPQHANCRLGKHATRAKVKISYQRKTNRFGPRCRAKIDFPLDFADFTGSFHAVGGSAGLHLRPHVISYVHVLAQGWRREEPYRKRAWRWEKEHAGKESDA